MTRMIYLGTHGPEDPTRATFPFHFANGAIDAGYEAQVLLVGDAAFLMKESIAKEIRGVAVPPLADLMRTVVDRGAEVFVWGGCGVARGVTEDDLRPFNAKFGTPKDAAELMAAADRVATF